MQRVERSIRVAATPMQAYEAWRHFENFPRFMEAVEEVRVSDAEGRISHWKLKALVSVEYDAELTEDEPGRSLGWRSLDGNLGISGNVTFAPVGDSETLVHVVMQWFDPPAGAIGEAFGKLVQNPENMLDESLRRFKDWIEGDLARTRREVA